MVINGIQCDVMTPAKRVALDRALPARGRWRGARDADPVSPRAALQDHLRRSMGADNYKRACDLLNELLGGGEDDMPASGRKSDEFTRRQENVGFTGAGDRSPAGSTLAEMFNFPAPQRL